MINSDYIVNGRPYALGGLINGEVDNIVFTSGGDCDVYDVVTEKGKVAIAEGYGVTVTKSRFDKANETINVSELDATDFILTNSGDYVPVISTTKRNGKKINIPKDAFCLNNIVVTRNFNVRKTVTNETSWNSTPTSKPTDSTPAPIAPQKSWIKK